MSDIRQSTNAHGDVYMQHFSVPFEYPVHFTRGLFDTANPLLASVLDRLGEQRRHRAAVYIDRGVADAHPALIRRINDYFHAHQKTLELACSPQLVTGGEEAKTGWEPVQEVMWTIGDLHLDRQSYIIGIGGGGVLDMIGFATSIVHRGLRLVRVPSTTLAQNDAGVGVKNGMDEHGQKNFVGAFAPPFAVLNDYALLPTLTQRDWIGGIAEAFKVAIIKDANFFDSLCANAVRLRDRDQDAMEEAVRRCAILHLDHIRTGGDPFEYGSARPLDFGHWAGHKLEVLSGYTLGHGQGVSVGIALDSFYALRKGCISDAEFDRILCGLRTCGLPIWNDLLEERTADGELAVIDGLNQFREHLGGILTITLPDGIGAKVEVHEMDTDLLVAGVRYLRELARKGNGTDV